MNRAHGQTDDLETLFARYTELEAAREIALATTQETDPQTERGKQIAVEFRERAAEAANWAASQLALF